MRVARSCVGKLLRFQTPAKHSFEKFPPMEAFAGLIAEFAGAGA
ncbi:hypothetical protein [Ciceribacter azotifigens]